MRIIQCLDRYASGECEEKDLERIVLYCHRVAMAHILSLMRRSGHAIGSSQYESIRHEAFSCITHLFAQSYSGKPVLAEMWSRYREEAGENEGAAFVRLQNMIRTVVWQQRAEELSRLRPQEWKVRRQLKVCVNNSEHSGLVRISGVLFIKPNSFTEGTLIPIAEQSLRRHCLDAFQGADPLPDLFDKAVEILDSGEPGNCIRFEDLAKTVIEYRASILAAERSNPSKMDRIGEEIHLTQLCEEVLRQLQDKIQASYFETEKVTRDEADGYFRALKMHLYDLLECGSTDSMLNYLREHSENLSSEEFYEVHWPRLSYLVKELKNIMREIAGNSQNGQKGQ